MSQKTSSVYALPAHKWSPDTNNCYYFSWKHSHFSVTCEFQTLFKKSPFEKHSRHITLSYSVNKSYRVEFRCSRQHRRRPMVGSRWWWQPQQSLSCWSWSRVSQPHEQCGSYRPWSPRSRSDELAWRGHPWGKPLPYHGGVLHVSWGRTPWTRDGVPKTYDETRNKKPNMHEIRIPHIQIYMKMRLLLVIESHVNADFW